MNLFDECLAQSHAAASLPLWEEIYRKAFPTFQSMDYFPADGEHQRAGIDRAVTLENSKQILIDEKIRGRNKKTGIIYKDIALEYESNDRTHAPGWVCKSLRCDYICYAIAPLGIGYLLPVIQMQLAWERNFAEWMRRQDCKKIEASNPSYNTLSLCVPVAVLFGAIGSCLRVEFAECECDGSPTPIASPISLHHTKIDESFSWNPR